MSDNPCQILLTVLTQPARMADLGLCEWDRLLPQARAAVLLPRLAALAEQEGILDRLPGPVRHHLSAARRIAQRQSRAVDWEARKLDDALARLDIPVVVLKGGAYALAGLPPARGRLFSDIDILVPKAELGRVEATLRLRGWHTGPLSAYDDRYYRRWMHELPPLTHLRRGSHLDVHHNLLPETARLQTRPELIMADARPLPGFRVLHVPRLEDLVLHSATHLFHEGEWEHGLRDLVDLDALLREGADRQPGWWDDLARRAAELNLGFPLALALRHGRRLLATPVPAAPLPGVDDARAGGLAKWRDALFTRGLVSFHPSCRLPATAPALFALYIRAHALRMPPHLLIPHLLNKAWMGMRDESGMSERPKVTR